MGSAALARYLEDQHAKDLLRFITCGSVDDGKSTLIGRLLHDAGGIPDDQIAQAKVDSRRFGTRGGDLDFALLVDGLQSEREQGITIDVAYRYFDTPRRKFILADTPGHEQYTRNMATGASVADLAILLLDASRGVLPQTRRHAFIVRLLGIRHVVVAVNKMDSVGYAEARFRELQQACRSALAPLEIPDLRFVPISALSGDNVVQAGGDMRWYQGPTLLRLLEEVEVQRDSARELRFPVQYVSRPDAQFRGYAGILTSGSVAVGDALVALPSGVRSRVRAIHGADGERCDAQAGESVMLSLADEVDVGRGQVLARAEHPPVVTRRFDADVIWMGHEPLQAGHAYELKFAHRYVGGLVEQIAHRVDVEDYGRRPAARLELNDVGRCRILLEQAVALDLYDEHRVTGSFIVIDPVSHATVGAGLVRRTSSGRLVAVRGAVSRQQRAAQKRQAPSLVWLTGLSGAGKSTIAAALEHQLLGRGHHTCLLDADLVRQGLSRDLGFSEDERSENVRRIAEGARLLLDAGLIVIVACIAPRRDDRARVRELLGSEFVEVHVDAPLAECERRDPKGHYRLARRGALGDFTGVEAPYEPPVQPELRLDTVALGVDQSVGALLEYLERTGRVRSA